MNMVQWKKYSYYFGRRISSKILYFILTLICKSLFYNDENIFKTSIPFKIKWSSLFLSIERLDKIEKNRLFISKINVK